MLATARAVDTMIVPATPGSTWRRITRQGGTPERPGGFDEILVPQPEHFGAHQPAGGEPPGQSQQEGEWDGVEAAPDGDGHQHEEDARHGESDVHQAHEHGVGQSPEVAGDGADGGADGDRDQRGKHADAERDAGAEDDTAPDVAGIRVGAEGMGPGRRPVLEQDDVQLLRGPVRGDERRGDGEDHKAGQHADTETGQGLTEEAVAHAHARPSRGSARTWSTSATRLPATTMRVAISVVAITTG